MTVQKKDVSKEVKDGLRKLLRARLAKLLKQQKHVEHLINKVEEVDEDMAEQFRHILKMPGCGPGD